MKIRGWSIDGFGVFRDSAVTDLPDGLTVLHGANEAGKSTLLEFIRRVLFGVPESGSDAAYAPLHGGRHRGRVMVTAGGGERLFRSVFAFSLDDLRSLSTLDAGGVHDALFSAALAGAGRSARAAADALRVQATALLDGEGPAQISRLIAELQALRPRLTAARRSALGYGELRTAAEGLA